MKFSHPIVCTAAIAASLGHISHAFSPTTTCTTNVATSTTSLAAQIDRRHCFTAAAGVAASSLLSSTSSTVANAQVFMDPAQYGDQELRVGAVDSVREAVRRAILKNPQLASAFYVLALTDGLSYNTKTSQFGPDGKVCYAVLSSKEKDPFTQSLQEAAVAILEAEKILRKKTAVTVADAIAIGGAEAIESIGGPVLPVQLGRADTPRDGVFPTIPYDLLSGKYPSRDVTAAFQTAGLTEREMTALLSGLLTLQTVQSTRSADDWKPKAKPKFREPGKMGRMSEFRALTADDIAQAELEADPDYEDPDDGWYIADSFGTRDDRFGQRLAKDDISEKNFNKYLKELMAFKTEKEATAQFGWISALLLDPDVPTAQTWLKKYSGGNLAFLKDLGIAYNSVTQLGAVYTGGKYENLLKNKPRKSLNNDDLNLF